MRRRWADLDSKWEIKMSVNRASKMNKILAAVLSVATIGAAMATTTQSASAFPHGGGHGGGHGIHIGGGHGGFGHHGGWGGRRWGGRGWGYGAVGLGLIGAAAYGGYYARCPLVRQFDEFGNYIGRVRTCDID